MKLAPIVDRGRELMRKITPRMRRAALAALALTFVVYAWRRFDIATSAQDPKIFPDSIQYLEIAQQPARVDHLFYAKPVFVPLVYRALDADEVAIARFQKRLAMTAYALLALALVVATRRTRARSLGVLVAASFLLAPLRVGFASAILAESISDSLFVIALACALGLGELVTRRTAPHATRWILAAALAIAAIAWVATRDTNAVAGLAGVAAAVVLWTPRAVRRHRWAWIVAVSIAIASTVALWSSRVAPAPPTNVTAFRDWPPELLARGLGPTFNDIVLRILPNDDATAFFVDHGMPQVDELRAIAHGWDSSDQRLFVDPQLAPARSWIAEHGATVYVSWLVHHPLQRTDEVVAHLWNVLSPRGMSGYMPTGWHISGGVLGGWFRDLTTSNLVLLALLLASPLLLRHTRGHPITGIAFVVIASGVVAAAAAYYGDAIEIERHCYGAGQQIVIGLYLALIARLDLRRGEPTPAVTATA